VAEDYRVLAERNGTRSGRTVIVFLVDGLQLPLLKDELEAGRLPAIRAHFADFDGELHHAYSTFPSLTFPAIASLLTRRPVEKAGILGNQMLHGGRAYNFETVDDHGRLNELIRGTTVFDDLKARGLRSVSFDYAFHEGATLHTDPRDLNAGVSIVSQDYGYVDSKTLDSLSLLLQTYPPHQWPDFVFVHLLSLDFLSHDVGPQSLEVRGMMRALDRQLAGIFARLREVETAGLRRMQTILTSDHGFDVPPQKVLRLVEWIARLEPSIRVLEEGRYMRLDLPKAWDANRREAFVRELGGVSEVEVVALRQERSVEIWSPTRASTIHFSGLMDCGANGFGVAITSKGMPRSPWMCVDQLDSAMDVLHAPHFIANIAHYFRAPGAGDAVVLPKPGVAFNSKYRGQHGGISAREVVVPLLIRGGQRPGSGRRVPSLFEVLNAL